MNKLDKIITTNTVFFNKDVEVYKLDNILTTVLKRGLILALFADIINEKKTNIASANIYSYQKYNIAQYGSFDYCVNPGIIKIKHTLKKGLRVDNISINIALEKNIYGAINDVERLIKVIKWVDTTIISEVNKEYFKLIKEYEDIKETQKAI